MEPLKEAPIVPICCKLLDGPYLSDRFKLVQLAILSYALTF